MIHNKTLCYAPAQTDACAYWRMYLPYLNIPESSYVFTQGKVNMNDYTNADVLVVQRMMDEGNFNFLKAARRFGMRIIFDLDDNLWNIPKFNPAARDAPKYHAMLQKCMGFADVVTVSTPDLKKAVAGELGWQKNVVSGKSIPIEVIENCFDPLLFPKPLWQRDSNEVVIGWGGSGTHTGDLEEVFALMPEILDGNPNVTLEIVGQLPPAYLQKHKQVRLREWSHISEFTRRYATWNWDIVLAPLHKHRFNYSKSSIKGLEAAAIGSPALCQDIRPYQHLYSFNKDLQWLLCSYGTQWKKKIQELISNRELRKQLGEACYQNAIDNFHINKAVPKWKHVAQLACS